MKSQSLLIIIRVILLLIISSKTLLAQDKRMERLWLQYRCRLPISTDEKQQHQLKIIDEYINEGNYQSAINALAKIKKDSGYIMEKNFLEGKAEYLVGNYKESLSLLNTVKPAILNSDYCLELRLLRLLNYNHLQYSDSLIIGLTNLYILNGKDTAGLSNEIKALIPPPFLSVRKAGKRSLLFPGWGLWYAGEKKHAVASAAVNFIFLAYTGYSIYTKYYITAALTGGAQFLRFYNGGKRASVKTVVRKNKTVYLDYLIKINVLTKNKLLVLTKFS